MAHGQDSTPTAPITVRLLTDFHAHLCGRGVTVEELLGYVREETSVEGVENITCQGDDSCVFIAATGRLSRKLYL